MWSYPDITVMVDCRLGVKHQVTYLPMWSAHGMQSAPKHVTVHHNICHILVTSKTLY